MRTLFLVSCLVVALPLRASADYSPPSLPLLVLASDAIVSGEIVALTAERFELRVDEHVSGPVAAGGVIRVRRFEDWTCASRWAPYAVGQRAVLFLRRERDGSWSIQSAGGEGEMPIVGDRVFVSGFYAALAPAGVNAHAPQTVHGGAYSGFSLARSELLAALRAVRACYRPTLTSDAHPRLTAVSLVCAAADLDRLRSTPLGAALDAAMHP